MRLNSLSSKVFHATSCLEHGASTRISTATTALKMMRMRSRRLVRFCKLLAYNYLAKHEVLGMSKDSEPMKSPLPQMYSLPGHPSPNPNEFAKLVGLANAESIAAMLRETAISNSGSQTPRQARRPAEDIHSAPSLVPSSRRPRQPKKDPPSIDLVYAAKNPRRKYIPGP